MEFEGSLCCYYLGVTLSAGAWWMRRCRVSWPLTDLSLWCVSCLWPSFILNTKQTVLLFLSFLSLLNELLIGRLEFNFCFIFRRTWVRISARRSTKNSRLILSVQKHQGWVEVQRYVFLTWTLMLMISFTLHRLTSGEKKIRYCFSGQETVWTLWRRHFLFRPVPCLVSTSIPTELQMWHYRPLT
jgi:hypothetical protein